MQWRTVFMGNGFLKCSQAHLICSIQPWQFLMQLLMHCHLKGQRLQTFSVGQLKWLNSSSKSIIIGLKLSSTTEKLCLVCFCIVIQKWKKKCVFSAWVTLHLYVCFSLGNVGSRKETPSKIQRNSGWEQSSSHSTVTSLEHRWVSIRLVQPLVIQQSLYKSWDNLLLRTK